MLSFSQITEYFDQKICEKIGNVGRTAMLIIGEHIISYIFLISGSRHNANETHY